MIDYHGYFRLIGMMYDRDYVEQFVSRFVRSARPEIEAPLLAVFDALSAGTKISPQLLETLADAASDRRAHVYDISTRFLGEIAVNDKNALVTIQGMTASSHAHVRHNAILCLTSEMDAEVCLEIIRHGLRDKSVLVRRKAADWAQRMLLTTVAPDIRVALKTEANPTVAEVMRGALVALKAK